MSKYEFSKIFPNNTIFDQLFQVRFGYILKALSYFHLLTNGKFKGQDLKGKLKKNLESKKGLEDTLNEIHEKSLQIENSEVGKKLRDISMEMLVLLNQQKYINTLKKENGSSRILGFI